MRMWHAPDHTRVVFDLSAPLRYTVSGYNNPKRISVDLENAVFIGSSPSPDFGQFLKNIRSGIPEPNKLRFVFEVRQDTKPDAFLLPPNERYGHRLVVDLHKPTPLEPVTPIAPARRGEMLIAIDAGHGGEDPGATGKRRTREKNVVLAIAKKLLVRVNATPGMRGFLTRTGDYYVGLRKRTTIARMQNADMFVSIHANAAKRRSARGSSVFALSQHGATSELAKILAQKENAADLAGGVSLADKSVPVRQVLLDLSMSKMEREGIILAGEVLRELKRIGSVHSKNVERASFAVLRNPDFPSILVETAFISNPIEEKWLSDDKYQARLADAILRGVKSYVKRPGIGSAATVTATGASTSQTSATASLAQTHSVYVVKSGDSLTGIAKKFSVSVASLRKENNIKGSGNLLFVGKKLRIPSW